MKYYGKAEGAAEAILKAFDDHLPAKLATVFLKRGHRHCDTWSWGNQFIVAIHGFSDARGFRQWEEIGRHVKKGQKAAYILAPCVVKDRETAKTGEGLFAESAGQESTEGANVETPAVRLVGFRGVPVFGLEQTEGEPIAGLAEEQAFIDALPLIEVARAWGITVTVYNGNERAPLGYYSPAFDSISLGEGSKTTWLHELAHAADDHLGEARKDGDSKENREIVAELSAAVLATLLGLPDDERDIPVALTYIRHYSGNKVSKAMGLIDRACRIVDSILTARDSVTATPTLAPEIAA
jgi:antirestriction protein ArdC